MRNTFCALTLITVCAASAADTATFDDLSLKTNFYENGSGLSGSFTSNGFGFNNQYGSYSWSGFAYSNVNDTTTAGYGNQYAAITGTAYSGSNYGIAYEGGSIPTITLPGGDQPLGVYVTNTTYAALSMQFGDQFSKKFGTGDWFMLTATGTNNGQVTGTANFYLADFRGGVTAIANGGKIVKDWEWFDLSGLGNATSVSFGLSSSDNGQFGMNTPAYFALDNFQAVPEPTSLAVLGLGIVAIARRRKGASK